MGTWFNGGVSLAVVIARFLLSNKSLLFSFTDLGLRHCVLRRTRQSTKWRICLVAGHVLPIVVPQIITHLHITGHHADTGVAPLLRVLEVVFQQIVQVTLF